MGFRISTLLGNGSPSYKGIKCGFYNMLLYFYGNFIQLCKGNSTSDCKIQNVINFIHFCSKITHISGSITLFIYKISTVTAYIYTVIVDLYPICFFFFFFFLASVLLSELPILSSPWRRREDSTFTIKKKKKEKKKKKGANVKTPPTHHHRHSNLAPPNYLHHNPFQ